MSYSSGSTTTFLFFSSLALSVWFMVLFGADILARTYEYFLLDRASAMLYFSRFGPYLCTTYVAVRYHAPAAAAAAAVRRSIK